MKHVTALFLLTFFGFSSSVFSQMVMPSMNMNDLLQDIGSPDITETALPENTVESVKSAIANDLIVMAETPVTNVEVVESIDKKTGRYPARIRICFVEFPLRKIAGKVSSKPDAQEEESGEVLLQTNLSIRDSLVRRIRDRLKLKDVTFEFKDRTARLSGTVSTLRQKELAESMLKMEPGIDTVQNELLVSANH